MEAIADHFAPLFKELKGFRDVTFFEDQEGGVYGSFSIWDSKEDADAAASTLAPELQKAVANVALKAPPQVRTLEIYEPRG
jgi:heme-degrading monooxygenase HmoA